MKHSTSGIKLLRHLANDGLRIFTIEQAKESANLLGINPDYVTEALHYSILKLH